MNTSKIGIELIKKHEGLRLFAYMKRDKVWTIGYGSTGVDVRKGMRITEKEAEERLIRYLNFQDKKISNLKFALNQNQFDAVSCLCYNIGFGNFLISTMYKKMKLNVNDLEIGLWWIKWNKCKGKVEEGLVNRRHEEIQLYFKKNGYNIIVEKI